MQSSVAQHHLLPVEILLGEDILGKERGEIIQRSLWFFWGVIFFSPQCSKLKEGTLWELSPPWGIPHTVTDFDPTSEQSPVVCHDVGPS